MGGVEVYRREIDGVVHQFDFAGLWGGGAAFTERDLKWRGDNTIYSTWTHLGLVGPREGLAVELAPAIWGVTTWADFEDRYGTLETCEAFVGEEILGVGCEGACERLSRDCPDLLGQPCGPACEQLPRTYVECMLRVPECDLRECDLFEPPDDDFP
ncbi:MAG: hypothetical protein KTR31_30160 [Myxococcales bacterium]|nr:hypothetical protein [Myxococcales bacterium]